MRYLRIVTAFAAEAWAMRPEKLHAVASFLASKAAGDDFTREEIEARIEAKNNDRVAYTTTRTGDVLVLPVTGVITKRVNMMSDISGGTSTDALAAAIQQAAEDDSIASVVLDIESPGGGVYGLPELAQTIRDARDIKPIVAQVNAQACSAAYWIASQCSEIVCTPSGEVGSIGVYAVHEDISKMLEKAGVTTTLVKAGKYKAEFSDLVPLTEEAQASLQKMVNDNYDNFVADVALGRNVSTRTVLDKFGQGKVFNAKEALDRGLIDSIDTVQATVNRLLGVERRGSAGASMRKAFADGITPPLQLFEAVLRDAGVPKALATDFVSRGKGALRRGDSGEEAKSTSVSTALDSMSRALDNISFPTLK